MVGDAGDESLGHSHRQRGAMHQRFLDGFAVAETVHDPMKRRLGHVGAGIVEQLRDDPLRASFDQRRRHGFVDVLSGRRSPPSY